MRSPASRDRLAHRLSAVLCLALVTLFAWGAWQQTAGLSVWTFEGRRELHVAAGELRAAPVAMHTAFGDDELAWPASIAAPAAYLVDFIYTRCPSVCRTLGSQYQQMQRALAAQASIDPESARVRLASISFDVRHDGAAELQQLASSLHADPAYWSFAVPASERDAQTLLRALGVVAIADGQGGFVHNGDIHLLDRQGRLHALFAIDEWPQALAAARRLAAQVAGDRR